jgi:uncharacterized membrane protein YgdD (TMEM256/DUF423 family)
MPVNALSLGALFGALTVLLGAFGAHALAERLGERELELWRTAVLYQGLHALALCALGLLRSEGRAARLSAAGFAVGTLLFSGSLYALALGAPRALGAVTPLGGLSFLAGWLALALAARSLQAPCPPAPPDPGARPGDALPRSRSGRAG